MTDLLCQDCGDTDSVYTNIDGHDWDIFVDGTELKAQLSDHEETREWARNQIPFRIKSLECEVLRRRLFDCSACGHDACVIVRDLCETCSGKGKVLHMYPRPGSMPGNQMIRCPMCGGKNG